MIEVDFEAGRLGLMAEKTRITWLRLSWVGLCLKWISCTRYLGLISD